MNKIFELVEKLETKDLEKLNSFVVEKINQSRKKEQVLAGLDFKRGQEVKFKDSVITRKISHLRGVIGKITKINNQTCGVDFNGSIWKVGYNLIEQYQKEI